MYVQSRQSQGADIFIEYVHTPTAVICQMKCVPCHMSCVSCHVSHVMCHVYIYIFFFSSSLLDKVVEVVGGGSVINVPTLYKIKFLYVRRMQKMSQMTRLENNRFHPNFSLFFIQNLKSVCKKILLIWKHTHESKIRHKDFLRSFVRSFVCSFVLRHAQGTPP